MEKYEQGQLVKFEVFKDHFDWGYITYPYAENGEEMVEICSLGKSGPFPILSSSISEVKEVDSYLSLWHKNDHILWSNKDATKFYYSCPGKYEMDGVEISSGKNTYFKYRVVTEIGKAEYLDRNECTYFYQFDKLVLLLRSKQELVNNVVFETIRNYMKKDFGLLEKIKFPVPEEEIEGESYFEDEMYYELT